MSVLIQLSGVVAGLLADDSHVLREIHATNV